MWSGTESGEGEVFCISSLPGLHPHSRQTWFNQGCGLAKLKQGRKGGRALRVTYYHWLRSWSYKGEKTGRRGWRKQGQWIVGHAGVKGGQGHNEEKKNATLIADTSKKMSFISPSFYRTTKVYKKKERPLGLKRIPITAFLNGHLVTVWDATLTATPLSCYVTFRQVPKCWSLVPASAKYVAGQRQSEHTEHI